MTGIFSFQSDRAGNFTRAQAAGAGVDILRGTVHDRLHALDIGVPGTVAPTMRVRNLDTERDTLATARTFGHNCLHLLFNSFNSIAYTARKCKCFERKKLIFFKILLDNPRCACYNITRRQVRRYSRIDGKMAELV